MTAQVYKDFLPNTLLNQLLGHILTQPHYYGHTSIFEKDKFKPRWYICELDDDLFLSRCILGFIIDKIKIKLSLGKIYANVQYAGQDGSFHTDNTTPHSRTAILMVSKTLPKGSGTFQIHTEGFSNKIETHEFEQNKLLFFKSSILHKGNPPLEPGFPRVTLAVKLDLYSDETSLMNRINNITNKG